jgi:hypothetical protein
VAEIAELTLRLVGEREVWSRMRVTRETVGEMLAELSGPDVAAAAGRGRPRRLRPRCGWWRRSRCCTGGRSHDGRPAGRVSGHRGGDRGRVGGPMQAKQIVPRIGPSPAETGRGIGELAER